MITLDEIFRPLDEPAARRHRPAWLAGAALTILLLFAFALVGAIDMQAEQATQDQVHQAMQRAAAARELERGLRDCPPPEPGMTDVVVMILNYTAASGPTVQRCLRFVEASYLPRRAR